MPRVPPRVAAALAVFGLFAVLGAATGYAAWSGLQTRDELGDVERAIAINDSYREAIEGLSDAEIVLLRSMQGGMAGDAYWPLIESVRAALTRVAAEGGPDDVAAVLEVARLGGETARRVDGFLAGGEGGTPDPSLLPDAAAPLAMKEALRDPAAAREREAMAALGGLIDSQDRSLAITLGVFTAAFATVVMCLYVLRRATQSQLRSQVEIQALREAALSDPLTCLGNQRAFEEKLSELVLGSRGGVQALSLALLDVDEFKHINDTRGHDRGDAVLRDLAAILRERTRHGETAFRLGGDEFALILPAVDQHAATRTADRLREQIATEIQGVTVSVGVASLVPGDADPRLLREQADSALYDAKARGRNMVLRFDAGSSRAPVFRSDKVEACRAAMSKERVQIAFQPIWDLAQGGLLGVEALFRPEESSRLAPAEAFQIAEHIGRAHDLDALCRGSILERASELPEGALLFMNVSPHSLDHPSFSPAGLARQAAQAGISPKRVILELTERSDVPVSRILPVVHELRSLGFGMALDDVGAGTQGFEVLRRVPVDYVKISRSVVAGAGADRAGRAALMAILAFAAEAGALVVAEGIDQERLLAFVRQLGTAQVARPSFLVHAVQGYLLGRPALEMPPAGRSPALRMPAA